MDILQDVPQHGADRGQYSPVTWKAVTRDPEDSITVSTVRVATVEDMLENVLALEFHVESGHDFGK